MFYGDPDQLPPNQAIPLLIALLQAVGATVDVLHSRQGFVATARFDSATFVVQNCDGNAANDIYAALITLVEAAAPTLVS